MRVVMLGDYALYFIPRLIAFSEKLVSEGSDLWVLQASKSLLYEKMPQMDTSNLNMINIEDAPKNFGFSRKVFYLLDKLNPDVLVTGFISFPFGAVGLKWAKSRNKGIIEYDDQRKTTFPRGKISNWVKGRILRNIDAFICPAPAWDETLLSWGLSKNEIFYGLDTSDNVFWGKTVENVDFKDLPQSYFMTVGRQVKMKNLPFFLYSYKEYLKKGGTLPLVMVGNGPVHNELIKIANGDSRIFFIDFQPRENIRQLFVRMKALILPSTKEETWGMVVNECMAGGHIVAISNECGSATTLIKDKINGFHFSPYDTNEIVSVLFRIEGLSNQEYQIMKDASLNIISHWGLDRFVDGTYKACIYAMKNKKKVSNLIDKLLIHIWNGRYNINDVTK